MTEPEIWLPEPAKILLAGDWHGAAAWGRHAIEHAALHGCEVIVQLGDFGFWRKESPASAEYLNVLQKALAKHDIELYWVDGNHEDHGRLEPMQHWHEPWVTLNAYSRITYLPRGYRWEWWGKTWMAVGGAVSVDKDWRTEGVDWWPEEELTDADLAHALRPGPVDIVIAHDAPKGVNIPGIGPDTKQRPNESPWPHHVLVQAEAHRAKMRQIWDAHHPTWWFHGHYHRHYEEFFGEHGKVVGLDMNGTKMLTNTRVLTPADVGGEGSANDQQSAV